MTLTEQLTLADFLLARIAEDQEAARAASPGPWQVRWQCPPVDHLHDYDEGWIADSVGATVAVMLDRYTYAPADAEHIARWEPARVLAECAAKRAIVEDHGDQHECTSLNAGDWPYVGCTTLRLLAQPYAGHPDYSEEWRV